MINMKMDAAIKKLRENDYRIEVFGPSPEGSSNSFIGRQIPDSLVAL